MDGIDQSAYRTRTVHFKMRILVSDFTVCSLRLAENIVVNLQELPKGFTSLLDAYTSKTFLFSGWFMKDGFPLTFMACLQLNLSPVVPIATIRTCSNPEDVCGSWLESIHRHAVGFGLQDSVVLILLVL